MTTQTTKTSSEDMKRHKGHRWFAALYDKMNRSEEKGFLGEMRGRMLSDVRGEVIEIGAGTGANFEHYEQNANVTALEPDPFMRRQAKEKLAALGRANISLQEGLAERLPFDDASFDTVVSTLVLCSVHDTRATLAEIRRVLKPGGQFRFIEHVRAEGFTGGVQSIIKPIWGWFGAGCHPDRRTVEALRAAGFDVDVTEQRKIVMGFIPLLRGTALIRKDLTAESR